MGSAKWHSLPNFNSYVYFLPATFPLILYLLHLGEPATKPVLSSQSILHTAKYEQYPQYSYAVMVFAAHSGASIQIQIL